MSENRVPVTIRLAPEEKATLTLAAEACGLDTSVAARQVLALCIGFLSRSGDDSWHEMVWRLNRALKEPPDGPTLP